MNNSRPTQCDRIMRYLRECGEIDQATAQREFGIMRLASRISELNSRGIKIGRRFQTGKNRYGERVSWAVYFLEKEEEEAI